MDEVLGILEKRKSYLGEWLERHAEAHRIAPNVQQNLKITEWEIKALTEMPGKAIEIPFPILTDVCHRRNRILSESLPMLPDYKIATITSATASTSGSSRGTYEFVAQVGDLNTPPAQEYSLKYTMQCWQIQENQLDLIMSVTSFNNWEILRA